jgi:hypothetical protein
MFTVCQKWLHSQGIKFALLTCFAETHPFTIGTIVRLLSIFSHHTHLRLNRGLDFTFYQGKGYRNGSFHTTPSWSPADDSVSGGIEALSI